MDSNRAVFLDRDGVINDLVYYGEEGILDTPVTVDQFRIIEGVPEAIRRIKDTGFKVFIVSNQPGIAKGRFDLNTFNLIRMKMLKELSRTGTYIDGEFYCFHHPKARLAEYKVACNCRKPGSGLILQASEIHDITLEESYMIGDGIVDVKAGKVCGCKTLLIGHCSTLLTRLLQEFDCEPDYMARSLDEAANIIIKRERLEDLLRYC